MLPAVLLAVLIAPAAQDVPTLSVRDLQKSRDIYDGRRVRVAGWLGKCRPKKCAISDAANGDYPTISIGKSAAFERRAARLKSRWVTIEGVVRSRCFEADLVHTADGGTLLIVRCGVRPEQLADPQIVDLSPSIKR